MTNWQKIKEKVVNKKEKLRKDLKRHPVYMEFFYDLFLILLTLLLEMGAAGLQEWMKSNQYDIDIQMCGQNVSCIEHSKQTHAYIVLLEGDNVIIIEKIPYHGQK